jgi:hypothetical protein
MKKKNDWRGKRVRRKRDSSGRMGYVFAAYRCPKWWRVDWPDGKLTIEPEYGLEVVDDHDQADQPRLESGETR